MDSGVGRDEWTIRMVCGSHLLVKKVDSAFQRLDWSVCAVSVTCCVLSWQASRSKKKSPMPL